MADLLQTPFHKYHQDHGGKMVEFAGWEMPILFDSIHAEHHHTRNCASLFDVSHMGRIKIAGRHARKMMERLLTRRVSDMAEVTVGQRAIVRCREAGPLVGCSAHLFLADPRTIPSSPYPMPWEYRWLPTWPG